MAGRGPLVDGAPAAPPLLRARHRRRREPGRLLRPRERALVRAAGRDAGRGRAYVELHAHSAYSFLDGASTPEELARRRGGARLPGRRAHRPRRDLGLDGVRPCLQGARRCEAITGAELTVDDERTAHLTLLVEAAPATATSAGCSRSRTTDTRDEPAASADAAARLARAARAARARGWSVCPAVRGTGCSRGASRRGDLQQAERFGAAAARGVRRASASGSSCSGPSGAATARATARSRSSPSGSACPAWRPATSTAHHPDRARLQDAFVAVRLRSSLDQTEPERRGNAQLGDGLAGGDGGALPRPSRRGRRDGARSPSGSSSTSRATSATAIPAPRIPTPTASWPSSARRGWTSAIRTSRATAEAARAPRRGAARDPRARALRLLPPPPRPARARPRGRRRGARPRLGARAAAARPRARLERQLDRLLPDRALAHRPDREQALPRAAS